MKKELIEDIRERLILIAKDIGKDSQEDNLQITMLEFDIGLLKDLINDQRRLSVAW